MKTKLLLNHLQNLIFSDLSHTFISLIVVLALSPEPCALSQIPQGFNYQAIARDGSGNPITNTSLPVKLTIQADSAGTIVIWQELFSSVTTNSFGLFTIVVGRGARQSGSALTFDAIDWSVTPKFIKTEVNYGGWKDMGTTRFWSVPYALRTKDTETKQTLNLAGSNLSITGGNTVTFPDGMNLWQARDTNAYRTSGRVGIGTSTPTKKLQVIGDAAIGTNWYMDGGIELGQTGSGNRYSGIDFHGDDTYTDYALRILRYNTGPDANSSIIHRGKGELNLFTQDWAPIGFYTSSTQRMVIAANGFVGIGGNNPQASLQVFNPATNTAIYVGGSAPGQTYLSIANNTNANGYCYLQSVKASPSTYGDIILNSSGGNVGIGTTAPAYLLDVNGSGRFSSSVQIGNSSGPIMANWWEFGVDNGNGTGIDFHSNTSPIDFSARIYRTPGNNGDFQFVNVGNGGFDFQAGGTSRLYLPASGNIGIGTKTPTSKVVIQPPTGWDDNTPLFDVKNQAGVSVFTVYNNGVRVFVQTNTGKGAKGGFAIGGFDPTKAGNVNLMSITPDSIRFYIDNAASKATKGGFAIGSFDNSKAANQNFMYITPQASGNGQYNTFMGYQAGIVNSTGTSNAFIGYNAGLSNSTGSRNVFLGLGAGQYNTIGSNNVFLGESAGSSNTVGNLNVLVGQYAGVYNKTGTQNVIVGNGALWTGLPQFRPTDMGSYNSFFGYLAGGYCLGIENTAIGHRAGVSLSGLTNYNSFLGKDAGNALNSGEGNVFIGNEAGIKQQTGNYNTYIGSAAGWNNLTGSSNIFIGNSAGLNEYGSNMLYIGDYPLIYGIFNTMVVIKGTNNPNSRTFFVNGSSGGTTGWYNDSDMRLKKDVQDIPDALGRVLNMRGVEFKWRDQETHEKGKQIGFLGQEVIKILPEVVDNSNDHYSIQYAAITSILVEAVKEQNKQIESQQKEINELKALVSNLIAGKPGQVNK